MPPSPNHGAAADRGSGDGWPGHEGAAVAAAAELGRSAIGAQMKLDYISEGSADCPILRLYDFTPIEAGYLLTAVSELASQESDRVEVNEMCFVEPIGACRLFLVRTSRDQALSCVGPLEFVCGFTANTWDNVAGLIEQFVESSQGFQWLAGLPGEASLLLSASGQW